MNIKYRPYAFTENGAIMAANVLNSPEAVRMSVFVVRAFVQMRDLLGGTKELARQLADLEKKLTARLDVHESVIVDVLRRVMEILDPPPLPPDRRGGGLVFTLSRKPSRATRQRKGREFSDGQEYDCLDDAQNRHLQSGRRHRLHPVERLAPESRGEGAWEEEVK